MEQILTAQEITSQFESEWVLLTEVDTDDSLNVVSGTVLYHSKDRDDVYRKAVAARPKRSAVLFTGEIPEDTAVVL